MDIFLPAALMLGMEWKKRDKKRKTMFTDKLCNFSN